MESGELASIVCEQGSKKTRADRFLVAMGDDLPWASVENMRSDSGSGSDSGRHRCSGTR